VLLVPSHYVELLVGPNWAEVLRDQVRLVAVGRRVEVDVSKCDVALQERLEQYVVTNRRVGQQLLDGSAIGPYVVVRRLLASAAQQAGTKSANRGDLVSELEALRTVPETSLVIDALLGAAVDETTLRTLGEFSTDGVRSSAEVRVEGWREWPEALGGAASANEIERVFVLSANHAGWRDRMVRRLTRLDVYGVELLANPEVG